MYANNHNVSLPVRITTQAGGLQENEVHVPRHISSKGPKREATCSCVRHSRSKEGGVQGDIISPIFFILTLDQLVQSLGEQRGV